MHWLEWTVRVVEKLFIIYFTAYFLIDLVLFLIALLYFRKKQSDDMTEDFSGHSVAIVVPAYNEEVSIVECVNMLLRLDYHEYKVIVVNDGSSDSTLFRLLEEFRPVQKELSVQGAIVTKRIRGAWEGQDGKLLVIDKENGGKADSINAGINLSKEEFICTIDADSILDKDALKMVVKPFLNDESIFVSGGQLAIANELVIVNNQVVSSKIPKQLLVLWQIIEYIKSFMVSRFGFSRMGSLLIMSGAFSLYRRSDLLRAGAFLTAWNEHENIVASVGYGRKTICEDMEIVIRLRRMFHNDGVPARTRFLPAPVCWTEVPSKARNLFKQRARWHTGLAESLAMHRAMLFEPKYSTTGLLAMPYYLFFELLAPFMKIIALIFLIFASLMGFVNSSWVITLLLAITLLAAFFTSTTTALIERWSQSGTGANRNALRYKGFGDWLLLIFAGILSDFSFAFFRMAAQLKGLWDFISRKSEWNKFERKGVKVIKE